MSSFRPDESVFQVLNDKRRNDGFSLIEVVLSLGIMSFALLPLVALLPMGLKTAQDSMDQTVTASIAQQIRGQLQQISFGTDGASKNINNLTDHYYTIDGIETEGASATNNYYVATLSANAPVTPGSSFGPSNAKTVTMTLSCPVAIPDAARKKFIFSLFTARQPSREAQ